MTAYSFENVMKMSSKQRCEPMLKMIKKHEYMESKGIGCTLNDKKKKNSSLVSVISRYVVLGEIYLGLIVNTTVEYSNVSVYIASVFIMTSCSTIAVNTQYVLFYCHFYSTALKGY